MENKTAAVIFSAFMVLTFFCYNYYDISNVYNEISNESIDFVKVKNEPIPIWTGNEVFLLNTTGCVIPNYGDKLKYKPNRMHASCGVRAITIRKVNESEIIFNINGDHIKSYVKNNEYKCCYKFVMRSDEKGKEDENVRLTSCQPFQNGSIIPIPVEIVEVKCSSIKTKKVLYEDSYMVVKKKEPIINTEKEKWNVLILGMDTMSRARFLSEMPNLAKYFNNNGWLDFKGYNKVGDNTYPNLMAILTGMNSSSAFTKCTPSMSSCQEHMLWSKYHREGYLTAYGEDNLQLPDTFYRYHGFPKPPTDHYMRPLFINTEAPVGKKKELVCTKHLPSAKHILDYANDFASTYVTRNFFGFFWINSFSHNEAYIPFMLQDDLIQFFESSAEIGLLNNTFILFMSDHGVRFGLKRWFMESYYKVRMPMLYMWVPKNFRKQYQYYYDTLQINQNRLLSPYDLHKTLYKIADMSVNSTDLIATGCETCITLFEAATEKRSCADAGIIDKWCTCHDMKKIDSITDKDGGKALEIAVKYVQSKARNVTTTKCWTCDSLHLYEVLRIHSYTSHGKMYYVIAFVVNSGKIGYEATVMRYNNNLSLLNGVDIITGYNALGSDCILNSIDRIWCICKKVKCKS